MQAERVFEEYICQSAAGNVINIEIGVDNFIRAIKKFSNTSEIIIKLTRKDGPTMLSIGASVTVCLLTICRVIFI